jgi:hypothetical protein
VGCDGVGIGSERLGSEDVVEGEVGVKPEDHHQTKTKEALGRLRWVDSQVQVRFRMHL